MPLRMVMLVLGVLLISLYLMVYISDYQFKKAFENEAKKIFSQTKNNKERVIAEGDLKRFPKPVIRYLKYANVIGKPMIQIIRLKQKGFMRQDPKDKWMPLNATQYYSTAVPSFTWLGKIKSNPLIFVTGKDRYLGAKGSMQIKLLSSIPLGNFKGKEMDQGAMTRYMNEMMWFPTAYLSSYIKWEEINDSSSKMTMTYGDLTASAVLHIDQEGKLTNFVCDRYRTVENKQVLTRWETPVSGYGVKNGFRIPLKGQAVWKLETGDFSYIQLEIDSIEYDKKAIYE